MIFSLDKSPLRNFFKYDGNNIYDLLVPFTRELVSAQHQHNTPLPPCAFVLGDSDGAYYNGYLYATPDDFMAEVALKAQTSRAVVTLAEFGSMSQDFSEGLVMICAQTRSYYRCQAFRLWDGAGFPVLENPMRIELPPDEDRPDEDSTCYLMGIDALIAPVFHNPADGKQG